MDYDPRILDIISAANSSKPADIEANFTSIVGERIADLVAERKSELSASYFGEPEGDINLDDGALDSNFEGEDDQDA